MAEPNEMSFGMWTPVGPRNLVADEGPDPRMQRAILRGWPAEDMPSGRYSQSNSAGGSTVAVQMPIEV